MIPPTANQFPPEYLNEYNGGSLFAVAIIFLVIETIFMILLYTSRYLGRGERSNMSMEIFMTLTYMVCLGKIVVAILMIKIGGTGHHTATLSRATLAHALKLSTVSQIVCPFTTSLSKLGVLCLLHRIFAKRGRKYRIAIQVTFGLVLSILIVQVLIPFINCRPFRKTWDPETPGNCAIPSLSLWRYLGTPNALTTIMVIAIPVPALIKLQVSKAMKLGLTVIFAVCIVGFVAAVMRIRAFLLVTDFHDITYENVKPFCWTITESGIYLVAGVMATLRPLLKKVFKGTVFEKMLSGSTTSSMNQKGWRFDRRWYRREPLPAQAGPKDPVYMHIETVSLEQGGSAKMAVRYA